MIVNGVAKQEFLGKVGAVLYFNKNFTFCNLWAKSPVLIQS